MPELIDPTNVRAARKVNDLVGLDSLRVDAYLTNFSLAYRQDRNDFISNRAATSVPVLNESDIYPVFPRGYFLRDEAEVRALGGRPVQVGYKMEKGNYTAEEWALEHTIDDRQRRNAPNVIDLDESGAALLESKQLIRQDRLWVQRFWKPGVWSLNLTGDAADANGAGKFMPFNDAGSDPVAVVEDKRSRFRKVTGMRPNTLVLGANVRSQLKLNPSMIDRIKYTQTGLITDALLAGLFEVENVMEAGAVYNAANEGAGDDFEFIADPDAMWLGYIEPTARQGMPTAIARFAWTGLIPGAMNNAGGVNTRGRDDRAYSDWLHNRSAYDLRAVAPDLGMFFSNASGLAA